MGKHKSRGGSTKNANHMPKGSGGHHSQRDKGSHGVPRGFFGSPKPPRGKKR